MVLTSKIIEVQKCSLDIITLISIIKRITPFVSKDAFVVLSNIRSIIKHISPYVFEGCTRRIIKHTLYY